MTLIGTIGNPRTGKTLLDTRILKRLIDFSIAKGYRLNEERFYAANYHFLDYLKPLVRYLKEPADMVNYKLPELYSGVTSLDELYVWLESRGSGSSSVNKILSQVAFQSGKSGYDILWSAQLSSSVDKRIRLLTDYFFVALTPTQQAFRYAFVSSNRIVRFKMTKYQASTFYKYYDTRERILPLELEQELALKEANKPSNQRLNETADSLEESAVKIRIEDEDLSQAEIQDTLDQYMPIQESGGQIWVFN